MRKLMSVAVTFAFILSLATITIAAPKEVVKETTTQVKAEVVRVEKMNNGTLLTVKIDGKIHVYHVAKIALKEAETLKASEKVELTLHNMRVHVIKVEPVGFIPSVLPQPSPAPEPCGGNPSPLPPPPQK